MAAPKSVIFFPAGFPELFAVWKSNPAARICAGGIEFTKKQNRIIPVFPDYVISLDQISELHKISRTERYIEIGAMVKLSRIIALGKIVPDALVKCLENIAGPQLRNAATIGGNICAGPRRLDASCPLAALDAHFELRDAQSAKWVSAGQFFSFSGSSLLGHNEILTKIRVPLEPWNFTLYRKFENPSGGETGGRVLFIMSNQKNILTGIRVVYSGKIILHDKNAETLLVGKHLPLERRDAKTFLDSWGNYLAAFTGSGAPVFPSEYGCPDPAFAERQLLNFIEAALRQISE